MAAESDDRWQMADGSINQMTDGRGQHKPDDRRQTTDGSINQTTDDRWQHEISEQPSLRPLRWTQGRQAPFENLRVFDRDFL
jgi:hypothetical protein